MIIRKEVEREFDDIYKLVEEAFKTAKVSSGDEQDFVDRLRDGEGYVKELGLIAEEEGELIGHLLLTETDIHYVNGKKRALMAAPLSVRLEHRCRGVGSALMNEGIYKAKNRGYGAIFLVGDPNYYKRFGFVSVRDYFLLHDMEIPEENVMVLEIREGFLEPDGKIDIE